MIGIGMLGASRIGVGAVIEPAAGIAVVELVAVAARSNARAEDYAAVHGIPIVEPDYQALVSSPDVDLVYVGLPPSEHKEWTIAALRAGKHVLCEKPFALNAGEAAEMVSVAEASGTRLIEAFHYRFHPLFARVIEIVKAGEIGEVERVDGHFNVPISYEPSEIRYSKHLGGGALMDLGCYPVHWARSVVDGRADVVAASADWHQSGVDVAMSAELRFPNGVAGFVRCSMHEQLREGLDAKLTVTGRQGVLSVDNPLAPHLGHKLTVDIDGESVSETRDGETTYHYQLAHVVDVIENEAEQLTGSTDSVETMQLLDQMYRAAAQTKT